MKLWHRIWVAVIGGVLILAGIVMLAIPGPGLLAIAAGLALLATEFAWAQRLMVKMKARVEALKAKHLK